MPDTERDRLEKDVKECFYDNLEETTPDLELFDTEATIERIVDLIAAEKADSVRLAILAKRYPIGIIVGEQNNKASFNQGWNACIDALTNQQTNEDKE